MRVWSIWTCLRSVCALCCVHFGRSLHDAIHAAQVMVWQSAQRAFTLASARLSSPTSNALSICMINSYNRRSTERFQCYTRHRQTNVHVSCLLCVFWFYFYFCVYLFVCPLLFIAWTEVHKRTQANDRGGATFPNCTRTAVAVWCVCRAHWTFPHTFAHRTGLLCGQRRCAA